ncbi:GNAT family N-acetyltransferase [Bacillus sp. REN3]|uniref:GNAT family N-acetyltransferase n=1 Tax=Bacillus sp. REN3 TaxID=2802440 RepID=UPI001AEDF176|nr:GNAT family N-acetyltransferase [Bacillus sp. REN3]
MQNVKIRRPLAKERLQLNEFFKLVITDTFIKEGIGEKLDDLHEECAIKEKYLENDLESGGKKRYFLIAEASDRIIGSIEYGPASKLICDSTDNAFGKTVEVGTVFVHPDYQGKGIGSMLLNEIVFVLQNERIEAFCLDSGYSIAQKIWKKKFGKPEYLLKDFWGEGSDHMIWGLKVKDWIRK